MADSTTTTTSNITNPRTPPVATTTTTTATTAAPLPLPAWKAAFLQTCLSHAILQFGTFTLKSGRISPYFFNAGLLHRAALLDAIGDAYAQTILDTHFDFDVLFGPAYKGIPLAAATLLKLAQRDPARYSGVSYAFDRKEAKDHGEGGRIVGCGLRGRRVLVLDDVITAGTAVREALRLIRAEGGDVVGVVVALDRGERVSEGRGEEGGSWSTASAIQLLRRTERILVRAIVTLDDIVAGVAGWVSDEDGRRLDEYRARYRASEIE
ncbi:MAG: orotate phosphoribosyltransferase [Phylliscum demangeonii]|nr:MAG: orotate phosphoribosyltransferase [Phylliscum demangeonii]